MMEAARQVSVVRLFPSAFPHPAARFARVHPPRARYARGGGIRKRAPPMSRYPEEAKNFRLLGHDPSAAWGGGSLVEVTKNHAFVGAVGGSSFHGAEGFTAHD